jgi:hypothetical protein
MLKCLLRVCCARIGLALIGKAECDTRDFIQSTGVGDIRPIALAKPEPAAPGRDVAPIVTVAEEVDQAHKGSASGIRRHRTNETA